MLVFRIFHVRNMIREARKNPGMFTANELLGAIKGVLILPVIIGSITSLIFFIIGYTELFGFQFKIFKFIFWIMLAGTVAMFVLVQKIIRSLLKATSEKTNTVIEKIRIESNT